jgi:hypothetical protein
MSNSKIRHIQESNKKLEQNYLKQNKLINEQLLDGDTTNTVEHRQEKYVQMRH